MRLEQEGSTAEVKATAARELSRIRVQKNEDPARKISALRAEAAALRDLIDPSLIESPQDFIRMFEGHAVRAKNFVAAIYPEPLP